MFSGSMNTVNTYRIYTKNNKRLRSFGLQLTGVFIFLRWYYDIIFQGETPLPSAEAMWKDVKLKKEAMARRYYASTRQTIQVDYGPFMDEIAEQAGCRPNLCEFPCQIYIVLAWLAQLIKALAAPTHVRSCVQEVRVRSPERTSSTLASISPGLGTDA